MLQQRKPLDTLNNVHNEFIVTPIDKANNNAAFFAKVLYALVLIKKLSLDQNISNINNTYTQEIKPNSQVIKLLI